MSNERLGLKSRRVPLEQFDFYDTDYIEKYADEYASRIGFFLIEFSELESTLNDCIVFLVNDRADDIGLQIVAVMEFAQKVSVFANTHLSLAHLSGEEASDRVKEAKKKLVQAFEIRNIIAHANWNTLTSDSYVRSEIKANKEVGETEFLYYEITPEILDTKIKEVQDLTEELSSLAEEITGA